MDQFIKSAIDLFNVKGIKFTVSELATINKMSKKTIYKLYGDKEKVIELAISEVFDSIKLKEKLIFESSELTTLEKLKAILCVFPSFSINFKYVNDIRDNFPGAYEKIESRFETDWDNTKIIIDQAVDEGVLKPVDYETLKLILIGIYNQIVDLDETLQIMTLEKSIDFLLQGYIK